MTAAFFTPPEPVLSLAKDIRSILTTVVSESLGRRELGGTCILASILLKQSLEKFGNLPTTIRGGAGERNEGYRDAAGRWHGHYWLEVFHPDGSLVLDVTCDQFGGPDILCLPVVAASQYRAGDQQEVDEQVEMTLEWIADPTKPQPRA